MNFRKAKTEDLEYVAQHSISKGIKEFPTSVDHIFTLEHEGDILGVGGFKLLNEYTAWCWMDWTNSALVYKISTYRVVREWLDEFRKQFGIKLLMAAVREHFAEAIRTVTHLGFEKSIRLPKFFGEEDAYLYILEDK